MRLQRRYEGELAQGHVAVDGMVLDASDAFWNIPVRPADRRFFAAKVKDKFYVFTRTAQGSVGGPLSWAIVFGLCCRCALSTQRENAED